MTRAFLNFYLFIIFSLLFLQFAVNPLLSRVANSYMKESLVEYNRQLSRGAFYMMVEDLLQLPEAQWEDRIDALRPYFGYKITLKSYGDLQLSEEEKQELRQGKIAVVSDGEELYQQVGSSKMVLGKGSFAEIEPETGALLTVYIWMIITVILALLTMAWIIPYWRKLKKISTMAMAFGSGDFDVRSDISTRSSLHPIASAFNTMADRIQQLISSHKELTNAVSHELKTPLSRLRFGLEMLENAQNDRDRNHYSKGLRSDVAELEELVAELLTYARFDREKPALHLDGHPLEELVRGLMYDHCADEGGKACIIINRLTGPLTPRYDTKYMARAIDNVLRNAQKYANGKIQIILESEGTDCCIHIEDDGPGVPENDRLKVFEPFTRLDASRNKMSGGYGLGLAIVDKVMTWHDGKVYVDNSDLGGAKFSLCWPGLKEIDQ
jgi:signal transduction histidine kinase